MNFREAVQTIIDLEEEYEAITILFNRIKSKYETAEMKCAERGACLRAIRKINNNKNEAIDALCDESGE